MRGQTMRHDDVFELLLTEKMRPHLLVDEMGPKGRTSSRASVARREAAEGPASGTLSVFAGGPIVAGTTEVPVTAGKTRALNFVPGLGTQGSVTVRADLPPGTATDVLLDVSGWFE